MSHKIEELNQLYKAQTTIFDEANKKWETIRKDDDSTTQRIRKQMDSVQTKIEEQINKFKERTASIKTKLHQYDLAMISNKWGWKLFRSPVYIKVCRM